MKKEDSTMVVIHTPIKMVTFGPWIPCSDEEDIVEEDNNDEVSSSAKADQVVCKDAEELITMKQDEEKEMERIPPLPPH